jgi:ADP-ribose pyrophosphatase
MPDRKIIFTGRRIQLVLDTHTMPDGRRVEREVVIHPGAVTIVPMVDADHVCLVRNRREAVGQTLLELPAGTLEPGEDPDATAARELAEETGYRAGRIRRLLEFFMSPGVLTEKMVLYLAEELTAGEQALDAGEDLAPEILPWSTAIALIERGEVHDAKTIVGLLYCDRLRGALSGGNRS